MEEFQCTIEYLHVLHVPLSVMFISWLVFWVHSSSTAAVHNVAETDFKAKVLKYFNKTTIFNKYHYIQEFFHQFYVEECRVF